MKRNVCWLMVLLSVGCGDVGDPGFDAGLPFVDASIDSTNPPPDGSLADVSMPDGAAADVGDAAVADGGALVDGGNADVASMTDAAVDATVPPTGCAMPGASNTGPSQPELLVASGSLSSTHDGQVIENVDVTGNIRVLHNNVVVRNFRVDATGFPYGVEAHTGTTGTLVEHGEVLGSTSAGVIAAGARLHALNIHDIGGDAAKTYSDTVWECNWMHHLGITPDAHADGIQCVGNESNIVIRGNYFDMPINESPRGPGSPYKSNAALIFSTNNGPIDGVWVEDNYMNGGNYTMYFIDKGRGHGSPTGITIRNNRIGEDFRYGTFSNHVSSGELTACGNLDMSSGAPVDGLNEDGDVCS